MKLTEITGHPNPLVSPCELRPGMKIFVNSLIYYVTSPVSIIETDPATFIVTLKRGNAEYSLEMEEEDEIEIYLGV